MHTSWNIEIKLVRDFMVNRVKNVLFFCEWNTYLPTVDFNMGRLTFFQNVLKHLHKIGLTIISLGFISFINFIVL